MSQPAARVGDSTVHGPPILGPGCPVVLIGGRPAWRMGGDTHTCPFPNAPPPVCTGTPHGPGFATMGSFTVIVGNMPAVRMGDIITEPGAIVPLPAINTIISGEFTVLIGGPTATMNVNLKTGECSCKFGAQITIKGSPEFVALALRDLGTLNATPSGRRLLESINNSGQPVTIIETTAQNGGCRPLNGVDAQNGIPTGSTVSYNPNFTQMYNQGPTAVGQPGREPWMDTTPEVILGHELNHAHHNAYGTNDFTMEGERLAVGLPPQPGYPTDYSGSAISENAIRNDLGQSPRTHYSQMGPP